MLEGRLINAVRRLVRELLAENGVPYHALVRYRVVTVGPDGRLTLQAVRKSAGWPDTLPVEIMPGLAGADCEPALGSIVLVSFVEGDPTQPVVTHFARKGDGFFMPVAASVDASGTVRIGEHATLVELGSGVDLVPPTDPTGRAVCYGDVVTITPAPGGGSPVTGALSTLGPVARVKAK